MDIAEPARRRIGGEALGLRRLAGFFEVLGWLYLAFAIVLALVIATDDTSDSFADTSSGDNVAAGLLVGLGLSVSALFVVMIARALKLFAEYVAVSTGTDLDELGAAAPTPRPWPPGGGLWAADPTGRHEFRYWDGTRWTASVSDGGNVASDDATELTDTPGPG